MSRWAMLLAALLALAPAAVAADEGAHAQGELTASKIFGGLFGHLVPHPVFGVWIGGDTGFAIEPAAQLDASGEPVVHDGHAVVHHDSHAYSEARREAHGGGFGFLVYNINTVQWIAGGLLVVLMVLVARRARRLGNGAPRGAWYGIAEAIILFVRDQMVYPTIGKEHGRALVPFFLTQFFFILFLNMFGLVPDVGHTGIIGTATASVLVTGALALTSFLAIHVLGMKQHGVLKHWKNLVPHVPLGLVPLMIVVEAVGVLVKPFALMVRLAANLTAGHFVVLGLFGLAYLAAAQMGGAAGHTVGALPVLLAFGIFCFELFVAFIQAYIFTYLSIVFVGASLHPEH